MDPAVVQALDSLIPALKGHLPQEVNDLAIALLAQSRSSAGSLKAEEEIARSYACANLACNRLQRKLGLPKFSTRPPCPPRTYQQMYRHFDHCLSAGTRRRGRPPKLRTDDTQPNLTSTVFSSNRSHTDRAVVSAAALLASQSPRQPDLSRQERRSVRILGIGNKPVVVPDWILPTIRHLCQDAGAKAAIPHVFVGVSTAFSSFPSVLRAPDKPPGRGELLSLLIAIYLNVTLCMSTRKVDAQSLDAEARHAVEIVNLLGKERTEPLNVDVRDVHAWIFAFHREAFLDMDWFRNVPREGEVKVVSNGTNNIHNDAGLGMQSLKSEAKYVDGSSALLPGLGTMMQDRVNFVSQARKSDYFSWKDNIICRIQELGKEEVAKADTAADDHR